jgi:hypothetical protein
MRDIFLRYFQNLHFRVGGPMTFRLLLQPLMAGLIGFRAGRRDAYEGRNPFLMQLRVGPLTKAELFREALKDILKVVIVAIAIDLIYQIIVVRWFYPLEALTVAVAVAILPYALVRGFTNGLSRKK